MLNQVVDLSKFRLWDKDDLPVVVWRLCHVHNGLLVGSQAVAMLKGLGPKPLSDWDVIVPFTAWARAAPRLARYNPVATQLGGWRLQVDGVAIDVWPDDWIRLSARTLTDRKCMAVAIDMRRGIVRLAAGRSK